MSIHPVVAEIEAIDRADAIQPHKCDKCDLPGVDEFDGYWLCRFHLVVTRARILRRR